MNILILTGNFGMGHNSAANAIAERIVNEFSDSTIYIEDLFEQAFKSEKYNSLFPLMVKQGKYLYNLVYRRTENAENVKKVPFNKYIVSSLQDLIEKTGADLIISTLWSCSKVVSDYKKLYGSNIPLITCITDVSSHNEWLCPNTDYYLIAAPKIKEELIRKGIDPQRIIVTGIPVRSGFQTESVENMRAGDKKLLIMGGGLGLLPKYKNFYEEINNLKGVRTTIITGNNSNLYKALAGRYDNINVLPYVNNVPKYMKETDLLISKPGGITLYEAISVQTPLLFFPPFLMQEIRNGEFIIENEIGDMLPEEKKKWPDKIKNLLTDEKTLKKMKENMKSFKSLLDEDGLLQIIRQYENKCA